MIFRASRQIFQTQLILDCQEQYASRAQERTRLGQHFQHGIFSDERLEILSRILKDADQRNDIEALVVLKTVKRIIDDMDI